MGLHHTHIHGKEGTDGRKNNNRTDKKKEDWNELENLKLSEIIGLKEDIDMICGEGVFEQSVGEDVSKFIALLTNSRRSSDLYDKVIEKEGSYTLTSQQNILEGNVEHQQCFIRYLASQEDNG